jgi:hypothetical protein
MSQYFWSNSVYLCEGECCHSLDVLYTWCGQNVCALNFFLQMWQHFRLLWRFGV